MQKPNSTRVLQYKFAFNTTLDNILTIRDMFAGKEKLTDGRNRRRLNGNIGEDAGSDTHTS